MKKQKEYKLSKIYKEINNTNAIKKIGGKDYIECKQFMNLYDEWIKEGVLSQYKILEIIQKDLNLVIYRYLIDENKI